MKADITRATFRSTKRYHSVVMQQGRVHVDADWNESVDILSGLDEKTRVDTIGPRGVPKTGGGFEITVAPGGVDLLIGEGRIYVDGLLCEIGSEQVDVVTLAADRLELERIDVDDRALERSDWIVVEDGSGVAARQITRVTEVDADTRTVGVDPALTDTAIEAATVRRLVSYATQPDLPEPPDVPAVTGNALPAVSLDDGTYLAYLDVWLRHMTFLDDPDLHDPALGGIDTTTRMRTMNQVRLKHLGPSVITDCALVPPLPDLFAGSTEPGDRPASTGRLAARARPAEETDELCEIPADARYQGMENQLYRVEVHDPGELGTATFKWSRENASIVALWTDQDGDRLTVSSTGRDADLGFAGGQLVELIDDTLELGGRPGTLVELAGPPRPDELTIAPTPAVDIGDFPRHAKVRRWDNPDLVSVEVPSGDGFIALENGVEVQFEAGHYNTGDYWLIPARTATRDVDWPRDDLDRPLARPPDGIAHHYAPLALVEVDGGVVTATYDCRDPFPSLTTITADDVAFDNEECEIPGARTVQDALDALCESSTLRRHNKHLHGWGIVCGLRVSCGPDDDGAPRSRVTVSDGYALDCEGNDLVVDEDARLDIFKLMKQEGLDDLLDVDQADVSLFMTSDVERGIMYGVERYDPDWDKRRYPLAGDFLNDVYEECIQPIHAFVKEQLGVGEESGVHKARVAERQSILASLMAQVVNPNASQTIYLSIREHEIARQFYDDLRALLASETFCAMFDDAAPFPDYPDLPAMDTIFGIGHHQRIRIRPGGLEAWTVGGGLNPVQHTTFVNRYDLEKRVLLERLAPFAGTSVDESEPDTGTGVITDVAFSPDGERVYVVAPTRNGQNTLFRAGRVGDTGVQWGELVTICDTNLLTLATTKADRGHVYAVGSMTGLYKIDPDAVDPSMAPVQAFPSSGHLVMTADGRGYATALAQGTTGSVPTYNRIIGFTSGAPTTAFIDVALPANGSDGLAVATTVRGRSGTQVETVYVTTGTGTGSRTLLAYDANSGTQRADVGIDLADSPVTLQPFEATGVLMVVSEDDCVVELVDLARHELLPRPLIPVQVGPVSAGASDKLENAYVLNYWSDTITLIPAAELRRGAEWPLQRLADYRRDIIHAFRDLLTGFLQYLKDCLCDHLMVDCPVCNGDEKIYLATVNLRDRQIYKVCNFSRRKYVKSFPTVDYWLSIVPIMPLIQKAVEEFCCVVLPDLFGKPTVPEYHEEAPRSAPAVRYSVGRENVDMARNIDVAAKIKDVQTRTTVAARTLGLAGRRTLLDTMTEPAMRTANLVDRPIDDVEGRLIERGVRVLRGAEEPEDLGSLLGNLFALLRTPQPGDEVTLHEDGGRVSYMSVARPSARRLTGDTPADVEELARAVEARDAEVAALRVEVERLQASQGTAPARLDDARVTALEKELGELRGLRDQVTSLLASGPASGRKLAGGSAKTTPKADGTRKKQPTTRRTTRKPRSANS